MASAATTSGSGSNAPEPNKPIYLGQLTKDISRLLERVESLSQQTQELEATESAAEILAGRDRLRHDVVEDGRRLSEFVEGVLAVILQASAELDSVAPLLQLHQKLTSKFSLLVNSDSEGILPHEGVLPHQKARQFVMEFEKKVIYPAVQARNACKEAAAQLEMKVRFSVPVSPDDEEKVISAQDESVRTSQHLREMYDEWITPIRVGFPELRTLISERVDRHCGYGILRLDVSPDDFEMTEVAGGRAFLAESKTSCREIKNLKKNYCIKFFGVADDFYREMEAVRRAKSGGAHHPNIAEVEFAFQENVGGSIFYFMAMPLYPVASQEWFNRHAGIPENHRDVIRVLSEMVSGLGCLHERGIVHGDLKPDNIMMDGRGVDARPKLIDFNFASVPAGTTNALPFRSAPLGISKEFAPPEFMEANGSRTPASDVFSLGKTFHALLKPCFESEEASAGLLTYLIQLLISGMTVVAPERRVPLTVAPHQGEESVAFVLQLLGKVAGLQAPNPRVPLSAERYVAAFGGSLSHTFEWLGLYYTMDSSEEVLVNGSKYRKEGCYGEALRLDPAQGDSWSAVSKVVGTHATPKLGVESDVKQDPEHQMHFALLLQILKLTPTNSEVWRTVGELLPPPTRATINGKEYTQRDCYLEALKLYPQDAAAWALLAQSIPTGEQVIANGKVLTKISCFLEALRLKPTDGSTWFKLGFVLMTSSEQITTTNSGAKIGPKECFVEALQCDPTNSKAWSCLIREMSDSDQISLNGTTYNKRQCIVEGLKTEPTPDKWINLGRNLGPNEEVTINGVKFNARECYFEAMKQDPNFSHAWTGIGSTMNSTERVNVNGKDYTQRECFLKALSITQEDRRAWLELAQTMESGETVVVNGAVKTRLACSYEGLKELQYTAWFPNQSW